MMKHAEIQRNLYDYLAGGLAPADRTAVEDHLASCRRCADECAALGRSMEQLTRAMGDPGATRSDAYWEGFADGVEQKIRTAMRSSRPVRPSFWEQLESFFLLHRGVAYGAGLACILLVAGLLYRIQFAPPPPADRTAPAGVALRSTDSVQVMPASQRFERYLRKSKILLVGISNMKTDAGHPIDLSAEREASRSLLKEARYLQDQDIDRRSARLISALNKILIELANLEEENDVPGVEIIRGGIHQENLLFKIRMAEVLNDSTAGDTNRSF